LQIAINLYGMWQLGRTPEAKFWLFELAAVTEDLTNHTVYAEWLVAAGGAAWFAGDNITSYNYVQQAIEILHGHETNTATSPYQLGRCLVSRGWAQKTLSLFQDAEHSFHDAAELARIQGRNGIALYCQARANEGELALVRGDIVHASRCLQELEQIRLHDANLWTRAWLHLLRGQLALARNHYLEAKAEFDEVISWRDRWPAINYTAFFLNYAAQAALQAQQFADAIAYFEDVKSLTHELGNLNGMAYACHNAALAALLNGDIHRAKAQLVENLRYNESIDHTPGTLIDLAGFAEIAIHEGRFEQAARLAGFVLQHYRSTYNTIFSLRRVVPETLVNTLRQQAAAIELDSLLYAGRQLTRREAIAVALA
jgi:tetratricopeptide (TPR) repeat protein